MWKVNYYHRNLLLLYLMAAGWLFFPALVAVLPKWLLKAATIVASGPCSCACYAGQYVTGWQDG